MAAYADISGPLNIPGLEQFYLNANDQAGWWNYLTQAGLTGVRPVDRFAQQNQGRYYGQYAQQAAQHPNQGFYDYLMENRPNLQADYMNQSPSQRFDFSSRTLTPRVRFSPYGG